MKLNYLRVAMLNKPILGLLVTLLFFADVQAREYHYGALKDTNLLQCEKLYWSGDTSEADACYKRLLNSNQSLHVQAEAVWALGDRQSANSIFQNAAKVEPSNSIILVRWGALYADTYQSQEALNFYTEALEQEPENPYAKLAAAEILLASGENQAVEQITQLADDIDAPTGVRAKATLVLANIALKREEIERAENLLDTAEEISSDSGDSALMLGVYAMRAGKAVRTRQDPNEWIDRALGINPAYGDAYAIPAYFYMITFRYDETGEYYQRAVDVQADHWEAHLSLAANHLRQNRPTLAREHYELAYAGDPFNPELVNSLRLLDYYDTFSVINYPESAEERLLPELSLRLDTEERDILSPYASSLALKAIETFSERYEFKLKQTAAIEIYPNHDDFIVRALGMPGTALLGVAFGYVVAMDSPNAQAGEDYHWGTTLWHEVAHIFTLEASKHNIPRWFSEGISVFEEWNTGPLNAVRIPLHVLKSLQTQEFLPIAELDRGFVQPEYPNQVIVSYMQAGLICEFVRREFGFSNLVDMLNKYAEGATTTQVVAQALELAVDEFDKQFVEYFQQEYGTQIEQLDDWNAVREAAAKSLTNMEWDDALENAQQAIDMMPGYVEVDSPYLVKAEALAGKEDVATQMATLEIFWRGGGYEASALLELATYLNDQQRLDDAIKVLQSQLLVTPFDLELHFLLGDILLQQSRAEEALIEYQVALALDPLDKAGAYYRMANALYHTGDIEQSRSNTLTALDLAPHYRPAQKLLKLILSYGAE
jgi:tetratricopeptide (TPR) repeat protein